MNEFKEKVESLEKGNKLYVRPDGRGRPYTATIKEIKQDKVIVKYSGVNFIGHPISGQIIWGKQELEGLMAQGSVRRVEK